MEIFVSSLFNNLLNTIKLLISKDLFRIAISSDVISSKIRLDILVKRIKIFKVSFLHYMKYKRFFEYE